MSLLDRAAIAARVPHAGAMCLLDAVAAWDAGAIDCVATSHADPANPLRCADGLLAPCGIEYAAQAMALHASLAAAAGAAPTPGFLASARGVRLHVARLDDVAGPIAVRAELVAGDARQALYRFALRSAAGALLVDGRATVLLNVPLPAPPT